MPVESPSAVASAKPLIIDKLSDPNIGSVDCPRRTRTQIDLILLAIEALDLAGSEAMLVAVRDLGLQEIIPGRVELWKLRSTNPLRKNSQRRPMSLQEAKALVAIACYLARKLTVLIRQLLIAEQQLQDKDLSVSHHFRLNHYVERFRVQFQRRMNPQRAAVIAYDDEEKLNDLALSLLTQLIFCTGVDGENRLWASLFDGEVA
ncbi:MAG: DUF3038 domain-containing protein [Cyanobacteria bacterium P01_A01_bin.105]